MGMAESEIRQLKAEDFEERIKLTQFAFQMRLTEDQLGARREAFRPERDYGLFGEDGRLLSALSVIPFEAWVQGRKLKMGGVAGVASWPDVRRQGGVSRLLSHALREMKRQGQSLSMLHPFSFAFYRKYGYEMTIERKNYTLSPKHFPLPGPQEGTVRIVDKDLALLDPVYAEWASRYDGALARNEEWWRLRVLSRPGLAAVCFDGSDQPRGYMLYEVLNRIMTVHEWVCATEEARAALWNYAANHDSMVDEVRMTVPADDELAFLMPDPRFKQETEPYFMSRIVDAEAFISEYAFAPSDRLDELALRLEDGQAEWNEGDFRLAIRPDGRAWLGREETSGSSPDGISCDIAALTALLVGGRSAEFLHKVGRLRCSASAIETLKRRVPAQRPYLADFF